MAVYTTSSSMTLTEAKKVLGTTAKDMSDSSIMRLIAQTDLLTDIVVAHANGSIIKSSIDYSDEEVHNNE